MRQDVASAPSSRAIITHSSQLPHAAGMRFFYAPIMTKTIDRIPLLPHSLDAPRQLVAHRYGVRGARPKAYLHASLHADEVPAMLVLHHLVRLLDEADRAGGIKGEIVVVPVANPIGVAQVINTRH